MSGLVKISEAANLALHACLLLARSPGELLRTGDMSERLGASKAHLVKVMRQLTRAGIVLSVRGPQGGIRLARAAADITLLEVYEAIEGPLESADCLLDRPICDGTCCVLGGLLHRVNEILWRHLAETTLEGACGKEADALPWKVAGL